MHGIPALYVFLKILLMIGTYPFEHGQIQVNNLVIYVLILNLAHDLIRFNVLQLLFRFQRIAFRFDRLLGVSQGMQLYKGLSIK